MLDLDYDLINELKDDLWFYYGAKDHWVPLEYHENLVKNVPDVDAEICSQNIAHAFVLSYRHIIRHYRTLSTVVPRARQLPAQVWTPKEQ